MMARFIRAAIFIAVILAARTAFAGTSYLAASGSESSSGIGKTYCVWAATGSPWDPSDFNAGTSKTARRLHAPTTAQCSNNSFMGLVDSFQ